MFKCQTCNKPHSSTRRSLCKPCFDAKNPRASLIPEATELEEELENLPDLPENWFTEPIQNLNGGHILKILLLGNKTQNTNVELLTARVTELEDANKISDPKIEANTASAKTNSEQITELEKTITTLKKTLVNQQEYIEQLQRRDLAKNAMITGIPNEPLDRNGDQLDDPEEKVKAILNELNPDLTTQDYSIRLFDPFTRLNGSITHSAKVTFLSIDKKKETLANSKSLKEKEEFFRSVYVKNDETKMSRNENYRLRKKAKALREEFPRDVIKIEKGVLKQNDTQIDKFDLNNQIFQ